jgi:hypothetical protein
MEEKNERRERMRKESLRNGTGKEKKRITKKWKSGEW